MAFIKTDKNIYELVKETKDFFVVIGKRSGTTYKKYKKVTVVKRATKLEDLFDEVIVKYRHKNDDEAYVFHLDRAKDINRFTWDEGDEYSIYGMMWAKGAHDEPILKPVAKFENDKWRLI